MALKLTPNRANAITFHLQMLRTPAADPIDAVERLVVVQSQYARNLPDFVASRSRTRHASWVESALSKQRTIVKTWVNRGTLHALRSEDLGLVLSALGPKSAMWIDRVIRYLEMEPNAFAGLESKIVKALEQGPMSRKALHEEIPELQSLPFTGWGLDVKALALKGEVVFASGVGGGPVFALTEQWLGKRYQPIDQRDAQVELLRRYLRGHAPASVTDFRLWSGLSSVDTRSAFKALQSELTEIDVDGWGEPLNILTETLNSLPSKLPCPPLRYLPKFDALTLAYQHKARFMQEAHIGKVFRPAGQIEAITLKGGRFAGTWRWQGPNRSVDWF